MKIILVTVLLGVFTPTAYRSVPNQTDSSPNFTATGEKTCGHGIAISGDLLRRNGGPLDYGDLVYIEDVGFKVVNDTMNARHKQRFDVWVATYKEEKDFDQKYGRRKLRMWIVKTEIKGDKLDVKFGRGFKKKIREIK